MTQQDVHNFFIAAQALADSPLGWFALLLAATVGAGMLVVRLFN